MVLYNLPLSITPFWYTPRDFSLWGPRICILVSTVGNSYAGGLWYWSTIAQGNAHQHLLKIRIYEPHTRHVESEFPEKGSESLLFKTKTPGDSQGSLGNCSRLLFIFCFSAMYLKTSVYNNCILKKSKYLMEKNRLQTILFFSSPDFSSGL